MTSLATPATMHVSFASMAAAQAARIPTAVQYISAEGRSYRRDAAGTDLTTLGTTNWALNDQIKRVGLYRHQPTLAEGYYSVDYSSARTDLNIYGYTANVKRTQGGRRPVAAQLNAYDRSTSGIPDAVFGIACEAWAGDAAIAPLVAVPLKGIEPAIISQWHDQAGKALWGGDFVFKNRPDGATEPLSGILGNNRYNIGSRAINISAQTRSTLGEYCGWNRGIYFASASLDFDTDGGAVGIDMQDAPTSRIAYAILLGHDQSIGLSGNSPSSRDVTMRFLESVDRWQVRNGAVEAVAYDFTAQRLRVGNTAVLGPRQTGWVAPTGTASRATFDTATVAVADLAQRVKALIDDLTDHGLIGAA